MRALHGLRSPGAPRALGSGVLVVVATLACACNVEQPLELVGQYAQPITGGQAYSGDVAIGMLKLETGLCTATLIGKRSVLTAAHCIKGSSFTFVLDNGEQVPVAATYKNPGFSQDGGPNDIAVARLSRDVPGVASIPVSTEPPTAGMPIVLIGYGATYCQETAPNVVSCTTDAGVKRRGENVVDAVASTEFSYTGSSSTCKGDSGGPALATVGGRQVVLGVTSRGAMPCGNKAIDTRVDAYLSWIEQATAGDVNLGGDNDPPQVVIAEPSQGSAVPAGTVTVRANITDNSGQVAVAQLRVNGQVVATTAAAPYTFNVSLDPGNHELAVSAKDGAGNEGQATVRVDVAGDANPPTPPPPSSAPGSFGADCQQAQDCDSGLCVQDPNAGRRYCSQDCQPLAVGECPGSGACMPIDAMQRHACALQPDGSQTSVDDGHLVGGCAVWSPTRGGGADALLVLLLLGLAGLRRRRG